jgi:hypothetical protein
MRALAYVGSLALASLLTASGCAVESDDRVDEDVSATEDALGGRPLADGAWAETTANLNFRSAPSTASSRTVLRVLSRGTRVQGTGLDPIDGFHFVTVDGTTGFVHGSYLRRVGSGEDSSSSASGSGRTHSNVTMLYQGDWGFLIRCDSYSRRAGKVVFACDEHPSREFVDEGAWIAIPSTLFSRRVCGATARVCKGTACIDARVVERSITSTRWEGSTAVLRALGVTPGWSSCTRSYGTATGVTVKL